MVRKNPDSPDAHRDLRTDYALIAAGVLAALIALGFLLLT